MLLYPSTPLFVHLSNEADPTCPFVHPTTLPSSFLYIPVSIFPSAVNGIPSAHHSKQKHRLHSFYFLLSPYHHGFYILIISQIHPLVHFLYKHPNLGLSHLFSHINYLFMLYFCITALIIIPYS